MPHGTKHLPGFFKSRGQASTDMNQKTLEEISRRTGLSVAACKNMLDAGWVYVEELGGRTRWESPVTKFKNNWLS
jgi:hypothetical protein